MATAIPMGIVSLKAEGAYAADKLYKKGMWVTSSGSSYAYINPIPAAGVPLTDASHWQQIAAQGTTGPSAYDAAVAGGYTGTEAEFNAANAGIEAAKENAEIATQEANEAALNANEAAESIPAEVTDQINTRLGGLSLSVDPTDGGLNITYTY